MWGAAAAVGGSVLGSMLGGKGGDESSSESPYARVLAQIAQQMFQESTPLRTGLIDTLYEALTTGGTNIPIVGQAVEAGKKAMSDTMAQTEEKLNQSQLGGTPFAQAILAGTRDVGNFNISQIEPNIVQALINMIPGLVTGTNSVVTQGLSSSIPGNISTSGTATAGTFDFGNMISSLMKAFGK